MTAWQPLRQHPPNPALLEAMDKIGDPRPIATWTNNLYQIVVREQGGLAHLSIKRHDRAKVHEWRHFQQIKNEICGPEREAIEIYPAESRLVDGANEYHLWVLPEGFKVTSQIGFRDGLVPTDEQVERWNAGGHKGRQEPWQEGLTTGRNENTPYMTNEQEAQMNEAMPDES